MLDETMFPRWVFKPGKQTLLAKSSKEHDQALADGWFATVGEADEGVAITSEVPLSSPEAHEADAGSEDPPTREELQAKATELGIKFDGRTSIKKLTDLIAAELED